MPRVCTFDGIAIYMYPLDHNPPHFHAIKAEDEALIRIPAWTVLEGGLKPKALRKVVAWATLRKAALEANWDLCSQGKPPLPIAPP